MPRLSNQEKSARRYETMNSIAELHAKVNQDFKTFCWNEKNQKFEITWRKLETFLKQKFERGEKIELVVESSVSGN